jgi:hypothetical protein
MGAASAFCRGSRRQQQVEIIKLLVGHGADVNAHDEGGLTPLMSLTTYGNAEAAKILLNAGAQIDAKDNNDMTALDHARVALKKYHDHFLDRRIAAACRNAGTVVLLRIEKANCVWSCQCK